jgi:D-alanyl-lipoteichoic acid acyltransferase DltB (MBOAT superfamily)
MDLYDDQWRSFRSGIPLLFLFATAQSVVMWLIRGRRSRNGILTAQFAIGLVYVCVLHGYRVIFTLLIALGNFAVSRMFRETRGVIAVWTYNLLVLVVVSLTGESWTIPFLSFRGMSGWAHMFNMLMLKQISFGVDRASAKDFGDFSLRSYLGYLFYSPLFLAGPIMTYESWSAQIEGQSIPGREKLLYAIRWMLTFLVLEIFLHFEYVNAITAQKSSALSGVNTLILAYGVSSSVLLFMWLKFLLIWRFFRLWSLANEIDPPENMNRCVYNNYSMVQFWKDWHSSFNIWLLKYVFVPLGGSRKNRFRNILIVFTFVALWHDFNWRVFHWALIVFGVMTPELICTAIYRTHLRSFRQKHPQAAKFFKAFFCALNTNFLILANMVGYVFGLDGVEILYHNISITVSRVICTVVVLMTFVLIMLWIDQWKLAKQ